MKPYKHLLSTVELGPVTLKNRVVMSGHHMGLADGQGRIGPRLHAYMVARARGGAAMVGLESSPVHPSSIKGVRPHLFDDAVVPGLRDLATDVHAAGSRLSVILWHGGHNMTHLGAGPAWAPSVVPSSQFNDLPKAMTLGDIKSLIAAYADAARRCRAAGLDAVEVQTSSDYLLGAFLNPVFNRRSDAYGGSFENRLRLICEVVAAVRDATGGDLAVGVRTSVAHSVPGDSEGYGEADSLAAMRTLVDRGLVDYVSLITGSHFSLADLMPPMTWSEAHLRAVAARFRAALGVPIMVAGSLRSPQEIDGIVAAGDADVVAMARPWIADPEWIIKVQEGREAAIRPCISCNQACTFAQRGIGPATCVVNPRAGREAERPSHVRAPSPQRIAVIGGGPAGLESARIAARRGHRVTLYEATADLGGEMGLAGRAPHRAPILRAIEWWRGQLSDLGVSLKMNTLIAPSEPPEADRIVWAIGGYPAQSAVWRRRPHLLDGIAGAESLAHGRDILAGTSVVRGSILIIDEEGGWPTISLAESLAGATDVSAVTVVTPLAHPALPELLFTVEIGEVSARLNRAGIEIIPGASVINVADGAATLSSGRALGPFDAVVLSTGTMPRAVPMDSLAVGDCVAPRGFWAAVDDADRLASAI
ncbi:MAG: NAD(P)-binding protein [Proteobacteria bacterium]|nr:NAD(P)-binding protein [Pseudomonadota bacterium]